MATNIDVVLFPLIGKWGKDAGWDISSIGVVVSFSGTVANVLGLMPEKADETLGVGSKCVRPAFTNIDAECADDESCKNHCNIIL